MPLSTRRRNSGRRRSRRKTDSTRAKVHAGWTFFGRILPERIALHLGGQPFYWTSAALGFRYRATIQIADAHFVVRADIESGPDDVFTLKNLVEGNVRLVTDYIGYLDGLFFDVDMISAACDDGRGIVFGKAIPILHKPKSPEKPGFLDPERYIPVLRDPYAHVALADFREAMRIPVGTGFFCYRAIEAMMQSMKATSTDRDSAAWGTLRQRLQIDRPTIDMIKGHSDYPRHGRPFSITDADRKTIFVLTDEIIRRYFEYLRRGKTPLPSSEFPVLTSTHDIEHIAGAATADFNE